MNYSLNEIPANVQAWKIEQANRLRDKFETDAYFANGALRWKSNGRPVPATCFAEAFATPDALQVEIEKSETRAFLDAYRRNPPPITDEDRFEARAALGRGVDVVNIVTGQTFRT
jgi:hypothetical protein